MKQYYNSMIAFALILLLAGTSYGQNLLQGTDMESEDYWNVSLINSDVEVDYEFGYDEVSPEHGHGGALFVSATVSGNPGNQLANIAFYQQVTLEGGETYLFDGAFKDIDGVHQFWAEIYIESAAPEVGEDWGGDQFAGFNTWGGCGPEVDGTFLADGCEGDGDNLFTVPGEGEQTLYFGVKIGAGSWDANTENSFSVLIDELSLTKLGETSAEEPELTSRFELNQNYPNPFNPSTSISFTLPEAGHVTLNIYSITGQLVSQVVNERLSSGSHSVTVDGSHLSSGLYIYQLQSGDLVQSKKMMLVK